MRHRKGNPLTFLFILGVVCLCFGVWTRYKAREGATKLQTWQRTEAQVESVEAVNERRRRGRTVTRYLTSLRYQTPQGEQVRTLKLNNRPGTPTIGVYYDPAAPGNDPEAEAHLRSVSSASSKRFADGAIAGGVVVLGGCAYWLRRRMRTR